MKENGIEVKEVRPFYETIVEVIRKMSTNNRYLVGELVMRTEITENHAEIIAAWNKRSEELQMSDFGVAESVKKQMK